MDEKNLEKKKTPLTRKLLFVAIPLFLIVLGFFLWVAKDRFIKPEKVHFHAGFIVIKNNQKVDFSDTKYMEFMPCNKDEEEKNLSPEQAQKEKAHLHDNVGDVVHVEAPNAKWKDLFQNLKYPIDEKNATVYENGQKVNNFFNQPIKPYESAVIFEGEATNSATFLAQAITKDHIVQTEKTSVECGK